MRMSSCEQAANPEQVNIPGKLTISAAGVA